MRTTLGLKYIPYSYMGSLGLFNKPSSLNQTADPVMRKEHQAGWRESTSGLRCHCGRGTLSPPPYKSYSLNSFKGGYIGDYMSEFFRGY